MTVLKRIMPCLLYNGKNLVKTTKFKSPDYIGDPVNAIKIYNDKEVDELVLLDVEATRQKRKIDFKKIESFAAECFMPFAYGGGVSSIEDFKNLYTIGVEKVIVNDLIFTNPEIVTQAAGIFGAQSVVASVDFKKKLIGGIKPFSYNGHKIKRSLIEHVNYVEDLGVGEILLYSVDRDGTWEGFDTQVIKEVSNAVSLPLVVTGGAGSVEQVREVLYDIDVNAAALGSMAVYQKKGMGVLIGFPKRERVINE